ncbi:MAG: S-layer homology domain-containing protein [Clostridiales bacterium]|nr:S-layer homology domain-containing protein [Clostridiales bacterium]
MKLKRVLCFVLVVLLTITSLAAFAEEKTDLEKATLLNKIGLISGDDTGFNLNGNLTRAEAATFIVKLLGKEQDVISKKAMYTKSNFPDIDGTEWYAAYIGYCERNYILSGYPDGTVKANNTLSEKAFLTMVLKALGYTNTDFSWDTVYAFSYNTGLVDDVTYLTKTADKVEFKRNEVVQLMFRSLNMKNNQTEKTILDGLVENKITTIEKIEELKLVKEDTILTEIKSVKVTSPTSVEITLNEDVRNISDEQIRLYSDKALSNPVNVVSSVYKDKLLTLTTDKQAENQVYYFTVANIMDSDNFVVELLQGEYKGYTVAAKESSYFTISKISAVSKDRIDVYFTHPVNSNIAVPLYYSLYLDGKEFIKGSFDTLDVAAISGKTNAISIKLKEGQFLNEAEYTLKIKGTAQSAYGVYINENSDIEDTFIANNLPNESIGIESIDQINSNHVRIIFDKEVSQSSVNSISNYSLQDTTLSNPYNNAFGVTMTGQGELKNRQYDIKWPALVKDREYEMTIKGIKDSLNSTELDESKFGFIGKDFSTNPFKIEYIAPFNSNLIAIYFTEPLKSSSVSANIVGVNDHTILFDANTPNMLLVYLNSGSGIVSGNTYNIQIVNGITDVYGTSYTNLTYNMEGITYAYPDTVAMSVKQISARKVLVEFDQPVAASNGTSKYSLEYTNNSGNKASITPSSVNYIDTKTAILTFGSDLVESYTLVITNLTDYSNQFTTNKTINTVIKY